MSRRMSVYSRPFKFVVVGECGSGKSTLIQRFISGFREEDHDEDNAACKPTFVCDGHSVLLKTTVKRVRKDGASVALTNDDIARRLWYKKFSKSASFPRGVVLRPEDHEDVVWDEVFVYLHKPRHRQDSKRLLERECAKRPTSEANDNRTKNNVVIAKEGASSSKTLPGRHVRNFLHARANETLRASGDAKTDVTEIEVDLWDTVGDKSLMWYRWYACTGADAVLLCVPLSSILCFESTRNDKEGELRTNENSKIAQVLQKFMSDELLCSGAKKIDYRAPPVLLVGTKSDECEVDSVFDSEEEDIVDAIGLNLAAEIGCHDFVSCSGLRGYGVTSVFEAALAISLTSDGKYRASRVRDGSDSEHSDCESSLAKEVAEPAYFRVHSFEKSSRPEVKSADKARSDSREHGALTDPATGKMARSPPKIFFPPPPDSSPPSTLPPSSDSSIVRSDSSASLDSTGEGSPRENREAILPPKTHPDMAPMITVSPVPPNASMTLHENKEMRCQSPTPVPRRRTLSNRSGSREFYKVEAGVTTPTPLPVPVPKPRRLLASPNTRRKLNRERRRETVFVRFLQT